MSHPGSTDREAKVSPQELEEEDEKEQDTHSQSRNVAQNMLQGSVRSENSMPADPFGGSFGVSDSSMSFPLSSTNAMGHTAFGVSENTNRNVGNAGRIHHENSIELLGSGLGFENRRFSTEETPRQFSSPAALFGGNSFDLENYESLTEDLRLNPLIDVNDPAANFLLTQSSRESNDSLTLPQSSNHENDISEGTVSAMVPNEYEKRYIRSLYARGTPQRHDNDMDRKPAAVDSTLPQIQQYQQQQYYGPNQPSNYPSQASKKLNDRINTEREISERKPPPVVSVPRRSARSRQDQEKRKCNLKPPPVASLPARDNRRSRRITAQTIKNKSSPKNTNSKVVQVKRSRARAVSKIKTAAPLKLNSLRRLVPTKKQLKEARTQRKVEALQTWFKRLNELLGFKDAYGHANVPQQYAANHSLGIWVNKQRMEKKAKDAGMASSLTDDKIQLLEEAGFVWAKRKGQVAWEEKFSELQQYLEKNGHCNVPTKNKYNRALGRWVSTQRANYKRYKEGEFTKHPRMDREELERRIRRLNGIGFEWSRLPTAGAASRRITTTAEQEVDGDSSNEEENDSNDDEADHSSTRTTSSSVGKKDKEEEGEKKENEK